MPRLVLQVKAGQINKKTMKIYLPGIITIAILLIIFYLMTSEIIKISEETMIGVFKIPEFILLICIIIGLIMIGYYLIKKFDIIGRIKKVFSSRDEMLKTIDKIKNIDVEKTRLDLAKKVGQAKQQYEDIKDKIPISQIKKVLESEDAKKIGKSAQDILSKVDWQRLGKGVDILKAGAEQLKSNILFVDEDTFPSPQEVLKQTINPDEKVQETSVENEIPLTIKSSQNNSSNLQTEDLILIRPATHAPIDYVPQINFVGKKSSKRLFIIIGTVAISTILIGLIYILFFMGG